MPHRLGINKADDQAQRRKLAYLAAPHYFNGDRDVWALAHASEIVNPTTQVLASRKLRPKDIDVALEEGRIIPALQLYCLARYARAGMPEKEHVRGFESLARYVDKDGSVVGPKYFLSIMSAAQRVKMFEALLQQSCDIISKMESNGYPHTVAAFNVTEDVLRSRKLSKMIHEVRRKSRIKFGNMALELLENIDIHQVPDFAFEELKELSELGVHIAVDDLEPDKKYEHLQAKNSQAREILDRLILKGVKVDTVKIPGECVCGAGIFDDPQRHCEAVISSLRYIRERDIERIVFEGAIVGAEKDDLVPVLRYAHGLGYDDEHLLFEGSTVRRRKDGLLPIGY